MDDATGSPQPTSPTGAADPRPLFAIVTGHLTPYRIAFHKRIVNEIPEFRLATLVTKYRTGPWVNPSTPDIGTVMLDPTPPPGEVTSMTLDTGGRSKAQHLQHEIGTAKRVWRWLEEHKPALVLCPGYDELPILTALRWANRRGVPVFMSSDANVHGDLTTGWKRKIKNAFVPRVTRRFDAILVCGRPGKAFFKGYGVPEEKMHVMPVEPDYSVIERMPIAREREICAQLGLSPDRKRIVVCCRLIAVKRVDLVIRAFQSIAADRPDWDLVIVGRGELQPELEKLSGDLLPQVRVKFLGFLDTERVAAVYRASHILALASDYEPWALVVNEACCAGMAIIASDRVGAAYELVSEANGRVVPAGNLEALTQALRSVTDAAHLEPMRLASRKTIEVWRREADSIKALRAAITQARGSMP